MPRSRSETRVVIRTPPGPVADDREADAALTRTDAVVGWILRALTPEVLERVGRAVGAQTEASAEASIGARVGTSVDDLLRHHALDLPLLVRTLSPDEWRQTMRRLGRPGAAATTGRAQAS